MGYNIEEHVNSDLLFYLDSLVNWNYFSHKIPLFIHLLAQHKQEIEDKKEVPKLTFKFGGGNVSVKETPRESPKLEIESLTTG